MRQKQQPIEVSSYGSRRCGPIVITTSSRELVGVALRMIAQLMFSMRFILQWLVSERARASVVPEVFWYFGCVGGLMLLCYAIYRMDPVFVVG